MRYLRDLGILSAVVATALLTSMSVADDSPNASQLDWPQWGGPQRDLVWRNSQQELRFETGDDGYLKRQWSTPIGEGYAGPSVADGRVFVMDFLRAEADAGQERVLCLDAETGEVLWEHAYPVSYSISYPNGPRVTPTVDGELVYAIGAMGDMFCLRVENGDVVWQKNFVNDFGTELPVWGMAGAPLIDGDQVITLVGGDEALVVSFNKKTGQEKWRALHDEQVGYAPPVIFEIADERQLIIWHPSAVSALNPQDGEALWDIPFDVKSALCIATPRNVDNRIFVTAFYDGPLMIEVDGHDAQIAWKGKSQSEIQTDGLHSIMPTPWMTSEHIYGVGSYGQLRGLDARTGKRLWETFAATGKGRWWNAFIIPHGDLFLLANEQGELIQARLTPAGYEELARGRLIAPTRKVNRRMTIWSHPAFAQGSVFARNDGEIIRVPLLATRNSGP